jgi:hypothetical protein
MNAAKVITPEKSEETQGTVVRGPDGTLYFIPDSKLAAFKVPEKAVAEMAGGMKAGSAARTSIDTEWMLHMGACIMQHDD